VIIDNVFSETSLVLAFLSLIALIGLAQASELNVPAGKVLSSIELLNQSFLYDNASVLYRGEVVGPVMFRGEYAWINVYDGGYAIGVWCPASDAKRIRFYGDYNNRGDVVEVSGVFHRACLSHGGDLDMHCDSLKVVEEGNAVTHPVGGVKILTAFLLGLAAVLLFFEKDAERYRETIVAVKSPIWSIFFRVRRKFLSGVAAEMAVPIFLMLAAVVLCFVLTLVVEVKRAI